MLTRYFWHGLFCTWIPYLFWASEQQDVPVFCSMIRARCSFSSERLCSVLAQLREPGTVQSGASSHSLFLVLSRPAYDWVCGGCAPLCSVQVPFASVRQGGKGEGKGMNLLCKAGERSRRIRRARSNLRPRGLH
ncbi:hypothetical protein EXIGLDRAFT_421539 [Exidia glandulosa HHB12029]|uniref:Secreted protein n=1 Tax=Exidia glandulosa HHB12029 TaxID=1314781 RepID=A0A165BE47_EXIGL|nr:hypothetical protein EXIGLDRAFT_421539 [Exidia glandulosa HHB12029]